MASYHFPFRQTAILNLYPICLRLTQIYFKITRELAILLEHMHKKFEISGTKIKGGCQSGRKVVAHDSKSDLPSEVSRERKHVKKDSAPICRPCLWKDGETPLGAFRSLVWVNPNSFCSISYTIWLDYRHKKIFKHIFSAQYWLFYRSFSSYFRLSLGLIKQFIYWVSLGSSSF